MKIPEIRQYLSSKYDKIAPFPAMFILNNYDDFETTKDICEATITDMYVVKALTYITLEKEDDTSKDANILRVFSFTRGLDIISSGMLDDLVEAKYGVRYRFLGKDDNFSTMLSFQAPGVWRTGVQFCQYELENDIVDESMISAALEFSENFATILSSITMNDLLLLKGKIKYSEQKILEIFRNLHASRFEMNVKDYLRTKYQYYDISTNYKPPYLSGKEIDVYAKKGLTGTAQIITICECKLKFFDQVVQPEEITKFLTVTEKVREHETLLAKKQGGSIKINSYLVTNSTVSPAATELLSSRGIEIMSVELSSNWSERGDWKITGLKNRCSLA